MTNFNDIENKFKETLNDFSPNSGKSSDELWANVDAQLQNKSRSRWIWWMGFGVLLIVASATAFFVQSNFSKSLNIPIASVERVGEGENGLERVGVGENGLERVGAGERGVEKVGEGGKGLERVGEGENGLEKVGEGENGLEKVGEGERGVERVSEKQNENITEDLPELNGKNWYAIVPPAAKSVVFTNQLSPLTVAVDSAKAKETSNWAVDFSAGTNYWLAGSEANTKHALLPGYQMQVGATKYFPSWFLTSQIGWSKSRYVFDYQHTYTQSYTYTQVPLGVVLDQNGNVVNTIYGDSTVTATYTRKLRSVNSYQSIYLNVLVGKNWQWNQWELSAAIGPKFMYTVQQRGVYVAMNDQPSGKITDASNGLKSFAVLPTVQCTFGRRLSPSWWMGIGVNASFGGSNTWNTVGKERLVQVPVLFRLAHTF